jgi:hypothetical protein
MHIWETTTHVIAHRFQIPRAAAVHNQTLAASAEQMAKEFVPLVEALGVNARKPFHARPQIGLGRLDHQMKMAGHQTIRMNLPARLEARLAQGVRKALTILITLADRFAPVAADHHACTP